MITVITTAYNRADTLPRLYESLRAQHHRDFEWIVVDDGSTDGTWPLLRAMEAEGALRMEARYRPNGGKHRALNEAVSRAAGELCVIVDSDDYLDPRALDRILFWWEPLRGDEAFAGVAGLKAHFDGRVVGTPFESLPPSPLDADPLSYRVRHKVRGDRAEVFRTDLLRSHPFPEYPGERFCPEALVWNRIGRRYKLRYFNETVYYCEYLPDGLSARITRLRRESPLASCACYSELYASPLPWAQKAKAAINYWRFAFCRRDPFLEWLDGISLTALPWLPLGLMFYLKDKRDT